jgi:hypothetical protein
VSTAAARHAQWTAGGRDAKESAGQGRMIVAIPLLCASLAAAPAAPAAKGGGELLGSGTYLSAHLGSEKIKETFRVVREDAGTVVVRARAVHPRGMDLEVEARLKPDTWELGTLVLRSRRKGLRPHEVRVEVAAGKATLTDSVRGFPTTIPVTHGLVPLFIDPGGLLAHHLTFLAARYDLAKGGAQAVYAFTPAFGEIKVEVKKIGATSGKRKGEEVRPARLRLTNRFLKPMVIEVDPDDRTALRGVSEAGVEMFRLTEYVPDVSEPPAPGKPRKGRAGARLPPPGLR